MYLSSGFMNDTEIRKVRSRNEIAICPYNKDNLKADNKQARIELLENILEKKKNNANAMYLKNIIDEIKNKHSCPELTHDQNDPENRRAHIIEFENYHGKMLSNMDNAFDRINSFSRYTYN